MPYTKITFVNDNPPAINATALNKMQTQYDEAKIDIDAHLADNSKHIPFATTGGVADAYTVTLNPAPAAYYEGMRILVKFHVTNTTTNPTINVNGLGARTIYKHGASALAVGELVQNSILGLVYYGAGYFCLDSSRDAHTLRGMFSVTSATANTIIQRDADGRAKVAAPSAADDIARKDNVDAVQLNLDTHVANKAPHPNIPSARVYHSVNQSIENNIETILSFNSERFDTDSIHDNVTNNSQLTCKTAGKYFISASIRFAYNTTGIRILRLATNTSLIASELRNAPSDVCEMTISTLCDLAVNDYVVVKVYQNSGAALDIVSIGAFSPEFMMVRMG